MKRLQKIKTAVVYKLDQLWEWAKVPAFIIIIMLILLFVQSVFLTFTEHQKPEMIDEIRLFYGEKDIYLTSRKEGTTGLDLMSHHMARSLYATEGGMYAIQLCGEGKCTNRMSSMTDLSFDGFTTRVGSLAVGDKLPNFLIKQQE